MGVTGDSGRSLRSSSAFRIREDRAPRRSGRPAAFLRSLTPRVAADGLWTGVKFAPRNSFLFASLPLLASTAAGKISELVLASVFCKLARLACRRRVGRRPLRPVLKHGPRSLTRARVIGCTKPKGAVKAKGTVLYPRGDPGAPSPGRNPDASRRPRFVRSSKSVRVGTRKMVNYAWPGRSQGKP